MSKQTAIECQRKVRESAGSHAAGKTIKGQLRLAAAALGYPDGSWRVRAAWYGHTDDWSDEAIDDLNARYDRWKAKQSLVTQEKQRSLAVLLDVVAELEGDFDASTYDIDDVGQLRRAALAFVDVRSWHHLSAGLGLEVADPHAVAGCPADLR